TRKDIKVDRVACPWLIRRFIDVDAQFLFVAEAELLDVAAREDAIPFDAPGLPSLALIVRAADISGQEHVAPEGLGLRAIAEGARAMGLSDEERLLKQFPIYDALLAYCQKATQ